jgi:hypothetical protein
MHIACQLPKIYINSDLLAVKKLFALFWCGSSFDCDP